MRTILDDIVYVLRSGCAWRLLPHDFPPWQTVYHYTPLFRLDGTWEQLFAVACAAASTYGWLAGTWPFGVVEGVWALVALRRWYTRRSA